MLHRIINFDESHLNKSSKNDTSRPRATSLTNPNLPQLGLQEFKDPGNHTTGVFGLTPLEPMPPVIIYETRAKRDENIKIQPQWIENLPIVKGAWGLEMESPMDTHIAI